MTDSMWIVPELTVSARGCELLEASEQPVLATVIEIKGGPYRRSGSKMLVTTDGADFGSATAGCMEYQINPRVMDAAGSIAQT